MRLGEILVRAGRLTADQLGRALEQQRSDAARRRIGEILCENGWVTDAQVAAALAEQFGMPFAATLGDDALDPSLVAQLPVDWARNHAVLPIRHQGRIAAALSDPTQNQVLDDLALLLGRELTPVVAPREEILGAVNRCYFRRPGADTTLSPAPVAGAREEAPVESRSDDLLRMADQAPVTNLVNALLLEAVKQRASDIHIEPFENRLRVRYRVDGFLYEQPSPPKAMETALVSRLKVMARLDIAEKRLPQDGMAGVRVGERKIDIRVSTIPVAEGERVVLRLLNREAVLMTLSDLGMPEDVLASFRQLLREPHGIVLVTGPTGSGKTTTLYAALRELDTGHANVLTIEDPIEYQLPDIGQMQIKPKIGLTFAQGLRHILRQDPDVIFVGEIRDLETAEIAVQASLTGHLVFSTLHTNDASTALIRLTDMGMEPYLIGAAMRGAMAQRLVRSLCPLCRRAAAPSDDELRALGPHRRFVEGRTVWRAEGCPECLGGYKGRTGLYELMMADDVLREAMRRSVTASEIRTLAAARGMRTLLEEGLRRALDGATSLAELLRVVGQSAAAAGS